MLTDSLGVLQGQGELGDITLVADETVEIFASEDNAARLISTVGSQGTAGDILITAANLRIINGDSQAASINASIITFGTNGGNSGRIATDISNSILLDGSAFLAFVGGAEAAGTAGNIDITTTDLAILNGAAIQADTLGTNANSNAGDITIEATGAVRLSGFRPLGDSVVSSSITSGALGEGAGEAGNVAITAAQLQLNNGASIGVSTLGEGEAGDVILKIDGTASFVGTTPCGQNSSSLLSRTFGEGEGGDIVIHASNLEVIDGADLSAQTVGSGDSGNSVLEISGTVRVDGLNPAIQDGVSSISASSTFNPLEDGGEPPTGDSGDLRITAINLEVTGGGQLSSATNGEGNAGNIILDIAETARIEGSANIVLDDTTTLSPSLVTSNIQETGDGMGGDVIIRANNLIVADGAVLDAAILGQGEAGNIILTIAETARFEGVTPEGFPSTATSAIGSNAEGIGGNVIITAGNLEVLAGGQIGTTVFGTGEAGDIFLDITETACFEGVNSVNTKFFSAASSSVDSEGNGIGGDVHLTATNLEITDGAFLGASNGGIGDTGGVFINLSDQLIMEDGQIETIANETSGGTIAIVAGDIRLSGDSDICTNVLSGEGRGGDITLTADTILAFDDSDILAFSADGEGGDVFLDTVFFFGQNFQSAPQLATQEALQALDGNDRVDVNATGRITSGEVAIPDNSFIENSFNELASDLVGTETLTAGSCIARSEDTESSFVVTDREGLPQQPGGSTPSVYPTGTIQTIPDAVASPSLQEPEGIYQLANGRLVLSQECEQ